MKKLTIIAGFVTVVAALSLPATSSAIWTHNHLAIPAGTNPQIHATGQFLWKSEAAGQINCTEVTSTAQLTGGQTTATIQVTNALNPETKCDTGGILAGCKITSAQALTLPWLVHVTTATAQNPTPTGLQVTGVHTTFKLHGFLCPQHITMQGDGLELFGEETFNTQGHTTLTGLKFAGQLTCTPGGNVSIEGTLTPTAGQSHTYGWVNLHS